MPPHKLQAHHELPGDTGHKNRAQRTGKVCAQLTGDLSGAIPMEEAGDPTSISHRSLLGTFLTNPKFACHKQDLPQHPGDVRWLLPSLGITDCLIQQEERLSKSDYTTRKKKSGHLSPHEGQHSLSIMQTK